MKLKGPEGLKGLLMFVLKILMGAGLVTFLFITGRIDFGALVNSYKYPVYVLSGILWCTLAVAVAIYRWWILAQLQKLPLKGFDALRLTMTGYFFSLFIPGGSGGDVVRAAYAIRDFPERRAQALTIAFVDRGLGLHALLLFGVSSILIQPRMLHNFPDLKWWLLLTGVILIIGTVSALLLVWQRANGLLFRLFGKIIGGAEAWHEAVELYRKQPGMLCVAYFFSVGSAVFNVLLIHYMMLAVGSTPAISESVAIAPLIIIANTLPLTPGGVGVAEGASAGLYALVGQAGGANGMLLTRFIIILFALLGFPFFILNKRHHWKNPIRSKLLKQQTF